MQLIRPTTPSTTGSNVTTDPTMVTPGSWSVTNPAWVAGGSGYVRATNAPANAYTFQSVTAAANTTYLVSYDIINYKSGSMFATWGGATFPSVFNPNFANGTYQYIITPSAGTNFFFIGVPNQNVHDNPDQFTGDITNVYAYPITYAFSGIAGYVTVEVPDSTYGFQIYDSNFNPMIKSGVIFSGATNRYTVPINNIVNPGNGKIFLMNKNNWVCGRVDNISGILSYDLYKFN